MCQVWCSSIQGIYAQLKGAICHGIYALCYIRNLFGVMVLQRSLLNSWGQSAIGICALFYIDIHRSAKFGVAVFKASVFFEGESSASRSD